jgi:hypothetical protein
LKRGYNLGASSPDEVAKSTSQGKDGQQQKIKNQSAKIKMTKKKSKIGKRPLFDLKIKNKF